MIPVFLPRNCATDLMSDTAIKSHPGLSWKTVTSLTGTPLTAAASALPALVKNRLLQRGRPDCDFAANAQQLHVKAFFF